ncbi:MAG: amidohydrolase family protein [Lachnospiraceae bacterium]|jgi:predicted TIM-barrel fold metal-dependent hydrolase|nr:amidohydrolase family protein [Lachnospiraceae bacterium]
MIIDSHIHVGPMARQYVRDYSLDGLLRHMDRLDISHAISCNTYALCELDLEFGARYASRLYEESGKRILSYHYYTPEYQEESLRLMEEYAKEPAYVGIKIHPAFALTPAEDEAFRPAWEFADAHKLPLISHTWDITSNPKQIYAFPTRFEKYIREYPGVTFIMAHSGGRPGGIRAAVALGEKYQNVWFDIAGDIWCNGALEYISEHVGSERILYGSDYTMMDPSVMLGVVLGARLTPAEKECILYRNAKELFGL